MMPTAELSDTTTTRLQAIAVPLVDTYDTVVARLLDHWDVTKSHETKMPKAGEPIGMGEDKRTMIFDPELPPQLNFTTIKQVVVDGTRLHKDFNYWNAVMNLMIRRAAEKGHDAQSIYDTLFVNAFVGRKEENGYKYLEEVGLSVQGQDSNAAFRQAYQLAKMYGISIEIWFQWQENEKAAYPGGQAIISL